MNKKIFITIIIVLGLIISVESFFLINNMKKYDKEIKNISEEKQKYKEYNENLKTKLETLGSEEFKKGNLLVVEDDEIFFDLTLDYLEEYHDTTDFINYFTKEPCDKNLTKITIVTSKVNGEVQTKYSPTLVC